MSETTFSTQKTTGYFTLVRDNANFRWLWLGQIISLLGDWFNLIASAALIAKLTSSGLAVGGLFVVRMLAPFFISPLAGAWADRYNRRALLILTDLTRAVTVFGFLLVRQPQHIWLLYALTAVQLAISGVFFPTRNAILPDLVARQELGAANALTSTTWSVMLAVGAALGGLTAGVWGIYPAFVIDGLTFLLSALFLYQISYPKDIKEGVGDNSIIAALREYLEGLHYLRARLDILAIALVKSGAALTVNGAFQVLQVVITGEVFVIGEGGGLSLGLMYMAVGVGTGVGPIVARLFTGDRDRALRRAIVLGFGLVSLGAAITATLDNFGAVLIGNMLRGIGVGVNWVFSTQLLLQLLPDRVRGRIFSTEFAILTLSNALGAAVGGWGLDHTALGIGGMLWVMAGLVLIPGVLWFFWVLFGRRAEPQAKATGQA